MRTVRRSLAVATVLGAAAALVVACANASAGPIHVGSAAAAPAVSAPAAPAPAELSLNPPGGGTDVAPGGLAHAGVRNGTLRDIALTASDGTAVPGQYSADRTQWTATAPLDFRTSYAWTGAMVGADGVATPLTDRFTTVAPTRLVHASTVIADGAVVGVAAPVEIQFDRVLPNDVKAAVERSLQVHTSVPVEGSWGWLADGSSTTGGSRVDYRPKDYWPAGTQVSVVVPLYGVALGSAGYGAADLTSQFSIGRSQIVKADVTSHRIVVIRDGQQVMDMPATYGLETDPNRVTRNGTHVVMGKSQKVLMTNLAYGYKDVPEYWAVRISNNGEFIHANPDSVWAQGSENVSHGCINLSTANAQTYYDTAMYGDPVEVTGSTVQLGPADGDVYDWAVPWDRWKSMSRLSS